MLITIPTVLNAEELAVVSGLIAKAKFVDGRLSAGQEATRVKHNEELNAQDSLITPLNNLVMGKLVQHPTYLAAALPLKIAAPYYARYSKGMSYGNHIDDPVMGPPGQRYRSDCSLTVFLNSPEDYDGGELVIKTLFGEQKIKLNAGDAVLYPSSSTHCVAEVTKGERLVAVTWLQSMVRAPEKRELLYKLHQARELLLKNAKDTTEAELVSNAYVNLVRMWSDV
jgi:PKHD-type hydroxylase